MTSSILSLAGLLYSGINQVAGKLVNNQATQALQQTSQSSGNFGDAVILDLSPAAQALVSGSPKASAPNPVSSISANILAGIGQTYSAGNKGALDSNNSYFDQLFAGIAPANSTKNTVSAPASGSNATSSKPNNNDTTDTLLSSLV